MQGSATVALKEGTELLYEYKIRFCEIKILSAPESIGFDKGPSHYLISSVVCKVSAILYTEISAV